MRLLTLSNLYPRPDKPTFGMFNLQLFTQMAACEGATVSNVCLVPEWRPWRWRRVKRWQALEGAIPETAYEPVFYLPVIGRAIGARLYALGAGRFKRHLRDTDVIYASWLYPDGVFATALAAGGSARVWVMVLGTDSLHVLSGARRRQILEADRRITGYVCVCRPVAQRLADAGIDAKRIHVVPNGVDPKRFHYVAQADARAALAQGGASALSEAVRRIDILFVGNLVAEKGPDVCLEAFVQYCDQTQPASPTDYHLVFIGQGPMQAALVSRAAAAGLSRQVHFIGSRPHREIVHWMACARCLCLSSRSEGMPNVVVEALAAGLPVVASDVGACREMLKDEPAARVVAPGDVNELARALAEVLGLDVDRESLARRHGQYTWRHQAERILELINEN